MKRTKSTNIFIASALSMASANLIVSAAFEGNLLHAFFGVVCVIACVMHVMCDNEDESAEEKSVS